MSFTPRYYQTNAITNVLEKFNNGVRKVLLMSPTGSGKTVIFTTLTKTFVKEKNKRVLILCHREELIDQTINSLLKVGVISERVTAKQRKLKHHANTYVAMIETAFNRLKKNPNFFNDIDLIICDECHILVFNKVFDFFPNANILGCSATPVLNQREKYFKCEWCSSEYTELQECCGSELMEWTRPLPMARFYDDIVIGATIGELINHDPPYLVPEISFVKKYFDTENLKVGSDGDYTTASMAQEFNKDSVMFDVVNHYKELCLGKKTMIFTSNTKANVMLLEKFKENGIDNVMSYDSINNDPSERKKVLEWFAESQDRILLNTGVFTCVLDDTELLTKDGWKKYEDVKDSDLFAQYDMKSGEISFDKPTRKVKKNFSKGYEMVELDGKGQNFCVTKTHNMLIKKSKHHGEMIKLPAKDIVGKSWHIPVSGIKKPDDIIVKQEPLVKCSKKRFISQNSYNYRKKNGMSWDESISFAEKMYDIKNSLRYKNPNELTLKECEFIGFWIGDGTVSNNRYQLTQSTVNPKMIDYARELFNECNINFCETYYEGQEEFYIMGKKTTKRDYITFTLFNGTGGKDQKVNGLYHLKPYLNKSGTDLFWGLNKQQLEALLIGLHYADGYHGNKRDADTLDFNSANRELVDLLQSISTCNGIKFTCKEDFSGRYNGFFSKNTFILDRYLYQTAKNRPKVITMERDGYYWCVTMPKETIITRRKGAVTIMGNTGFDDREVEAIIMARATTSLSLFLQIVGRGGRTSDKILKDSFIFIDGGDNIAKHLEWSDDTRDWEMIFYKGVGEDKPKKQVLDQTKDCDNCGAIYLRTQKICPECGVEEEVPEPIIHELDFEEGAVLEPIKKIPKPNGQIIYNFVVSQQKDINFAFRILENKVVDMFHMYRVDAETYLATKQSGELQYKIKDMINKCYHVLVSKKDIIPDNWQGRTIQTLINRTITKLDKKYDVFTISEHKEQT